MTRPRPHRSTAARPLGILLGVDDGLLECIPGSPPTRGIDGPRITAVDAREGFAVAGGPGAGVWAHSGLRWRQVWEGDARCVQIGSEATYLGTGDGRLLTSTDEGETWTKVGGTAELRHDGGALPSRSAPPAVVGVEEVRGGLVVAFDGGGAWFRADAGASWFRRSDGIDPRVHRLYRHPELAERLYVTTSSGMYRSTDEGLTWLQSLKDLDRSWGGSLAVLPAATDTLVLSLARRVPGGAPGAGALFRSVNAGLTWSRVLLDGEDEWERAPAVVRPQEWEDVVFTAAGTRLFASHDRGRTWMPLAADLPPAHAIAASV